MNNKKVTDKEYLTYIDDYFNILINNFRSATSKKIPYSEIYEMVNELDTMINKIALNNIKIIGNSAINKYIPLLELLLKLDNNQEHAFFYEKCLKNAYKLSARVSFEHYMIFREWDEKDKFFMPRYNIMKGYAHYLQELTMNPKFETVIFNAPSGYGKTYPEKINEAWSYGIDSTGTTLALCSNENVVLGGSRLVIDEIKSEPFGEVFPHLKYTKEDKDFFLKETAGEWKLRDCKLLASYYASTVKSNVVGSRASKIIHIDDLYADYNEAMNQELNELYFNKYLTVWSKRFVQNKIPKVCVTGTLWANGDFIARLIEYYKGIYKFKKDPKYPYTLINEEETVVIIQVPALDYVTGESTCPEIKSTEQVLRDKDAMDDYLFQTNFQQVPTDPEALIFSWNKLRTYQKIPTSTEYSNVAVIDGTRKTGNDNFSMPIFKKMFNGDFFEFHLIDCIFSQTATKDLIPDIVEKIIKHKIKTLVIETNVDGGLKKVLQEKLAEKGYYQIDMIEIYSTANKQARIEDQKGNILRNLVFPAKHLFGFKSDVGKFLENLVTYNNKGRNSHDDAPDSCAILTKELVDEGSAPAKAIPIKRPF